MRFVGRGRGTVVSVRIVQPTMRSRLPYLALGLSLLCACSNADNSIAPTTPTVATTLPQEPTSTIDPRITVDGIHFVLPAELKYQAEGTPPPTVGETVLGYYATVPIAAPCQITATSTACSLSLTTLPWGAMLVSWGNVGVPRPAGEPDVPGANTTIGGQVAKLTRERPGSCGDIGADETITAEIARPAAPGNTYRMRACIRGPNATANADLIWTMLASVDIDT